jgi:hypothetical protein
VKLNLVTSIFGDVAGVLQIEHLLDLDPPKRTQYFGGPILVRIGNGDEIAHDGPSCCTSSTGCMVLATALAKPETPAGIAP